MFRRIAQLLLCAAAIVARAAPDVTSSLEYLFAPMESRYGTSADNLSSRAVHCMEYLDGRIYIGGGDWNSNTGPVPIISILPGETPTWTNEYSAGTEHIEAFKKFSDGRIWTRSTDPREHDANYGYFFAKQPGGDWVRCPLGKIDWNPAHQLNGAELYTHEWDFCEYDGKFYFTGFGVGGSQYWLNGDDTFSHQMGSVTAGQTNGYYRYTYYTNGKKTAEAENYERFLTLMPFTNGCIAVTWHYYVSANPDLNQCYYWKLDDPPGWQFRRVDCPWDTFLNGYQDVDRELYSSSYSWWLHFREATPFKGRVFYIVTPGCAMDVPIGFFAASMDASGNITSQRHAFDGGHSHPIDIAVVGGAMYVMTVKYDSASSIAHAIWKTTDGQSFTKLATFTSDQYFESFTYAKGCFYLGYGAAHIGHYNGKSASPVTDKAGQIWRFALLQVDDDGSNDGPTPSLPEDPDPSDEPEDTNLPDEPNVPEANNGWFRVDCVAAIVSAPLDYEPQIVGYCASNAFFELEMPFDACEEAPTPKTGAKCVFCLAPSDGGLSYMAYAADGWRSVTNAAAIPVAGARRRLRMELEAGTPSARRFRCLIDGNALADAAGNYWLPMASGGDVAEISIDGDGLVSEFFGRFTESFGGGLSLLERLGGVLPRIGDFTDGNGAAVPAFTVADGEVAVSVPATVAGIYYTAFTAQSLNGPWTAAAESSLSSGGPIRFAFSTLDPSTGKSYPTLFVSIVASDAPYAVGETR
ncbi:MAG: hypothetical protein IJT64_02415 [Kiritimatiellae bacterium]|nr:hypothetical protein [Kiritimatiellia bacterium]